MIAEQIGKMISDAMLFNVRRGYMGKDLIDRNTLSKSAWETKDVDGSSVSVVSLKDIHDAPPFGMMPKGTYCVIVTEDEMDMLIQSLDVMGDRKADREGYSAGEDYWDFKEKLEQIQEEGAKRDSLGRMVSDAQARSSAEKAPAHEKSREDELER